MKRFLSFVLVITLVLSIMPTGLFGITANAATTASGTCGENLTWTLDSDGVLTISGTGMMDNYLSTVSAPWYNYRSSIQRIVIEQGVTSVGSCVFSNCTNTTQITIPNSVTCIGYDAFAYCSNLTSITIPNSVTSIGWSAFSFCSSLTNITIPNSVTSIESWTFEDCSNLTSITIPNSVTNIGNWAFLGCSKLTNVTYCGTKTKWNKISIGSDNSNLTNATRKYHSWLGGAEDNRLTCSICGMYEDTADYGTCGKNLTWSLDVAGVLTISGIGDMSEYVSSTSAPWYNYRSLIKNVIIEQGVTSVGDYAFCGYYSLTSVTISDSVTSIREGAFYNCSNLASVTIGKNVTDIGERAFGVCSKLASVSIPDSVTSIGESAFACCYSLTNITIPNSVKNIDNSAFSYCDNLVSIIMYNGVKTIGDYAFQSCSNLVSITIPNSVTNIGYKAFYDCSKLDSIAIGDGIVSIGEYAFYECPKLKNVIYCEREEKWNEISIGSNNVSLTSASRKYHDWTESAENGVVCSVCGISVETIVAFGTCGENLMWTLNGGGVLTISGTGDMEHYSFSGSIPWHSYRSAIKNVVIEQGVTGIGNYAFENCTNLTSIDIPNSAAYIGNFAFCGCSNLIDITIPDSVTSIGQSAFFNCSNLTNITIPNGVTIIEYYAFFGCSNLTNITIPDSVTSIDQYSFYKCSKLTSVIIGNSVTSIRNYAFKDCTNLASVTIGNSVTGIGNYTFENCTSLTSIAIPNCIMDIGYRAFYGCSNLTNVTYCGTETEWNKISIGSSNYDLINATLKYHDYDEETKVCSVCKLINSPEIFKDVAENSWYKEYVDFAVTYGIFKGTASDIFSPETDMTRAQMVQVFANLSGIDTTNSNVESGFKDVPKGTWYTSAVTWAAQNKIVSGVGDGKFDPDAKITREQMCLMLCNYIEKCLGKTIEPEKEVSTFADDGSISDWAKEAVYKCAKSGLVNGVGNNKFDPQSTATRAQGATLFTNFYKKYM
ncbi:MAG: leucine-rich repeat protein [Clostridia bacterium]|nr:leucine-rich repeat protein [Clostridia bacterium]